MPENLAQFHADVISALGQHAAQFNLEVIKECGSTNSELQTRASAGAASGSVLVAWQQTAGRGRMGRTWFAHPEDSLTFSLLWRFAHTTPLTGLSLAVGVAVVDALHGLGITALKLKWPNDVYREGKKVAGVLIETHSNAAGSVIIGIGINLRLPKNLPDDLQSSCAALGTALRSATLLAAILVSLERRLQQFASQGFAASAAHWLALCAHLEQLVTILPADPRTMPIVGHCLGVDNNGALLLETATGVVHITAGDVSLRL